MLLPDHDVEVVVIEVAVGHPLHQGVELYDPGCAIRVSVYAVRDYARARSAVHLHRGDAEAPDPVLPRLADGGTYVEHLRVRGAQDVLSVGPEEAHVGRGAHTALCAQGRNARAGQGIVCGGLQPADVKGRSGLSLRLQGVALVWSRRVGAPSCDLLRRGASQLVRHEGHGRAVLELHDLLPGQLVPVDADGLRLVRRLGVHARRQDRLARLLEHRVVDGRQLVEQLVERLVGHGAQRCLLCLRREVLTVPVVVEVREGL